MNHIIIHTAKQAKRLAMIVKPGPAIVVIPVVLALLATEMIWRKSN